MLLIVIPLISLVIFLTTCVAMLCIVFYSTEFFVGGVALQIRQWRHTATDEDKVWKKKYLRMSISFFVLGLALLALPYTMLGPTIGDHLILRVFSVLCITALSLGYLIAMYVKLKTPEETLAQLRRGYHKASV